MSKYSDMYGLSNVGDLEETAEILARALGMPFQGRTDDWWGDYYIARNEERTEQIRLLDDSGEESYLKEDYGDYHLFLEVHVGSLERAREIEERLREAREPLQQAYLKSQQAYKERNREYFQRVRERRAREEEERLEERRAALSRRELPGYSPEQTKELLESIGPQRYQERLMASWESAVQFSKKRLAEDPFPIIPKEPEIVLLKRKRY